MPERERMRDEGHDRLLRGYRATAGKADELVFPDGSLRPVWRGLIDHLARLTPPEVEMRFARGDRYLRDAGVFYRKYDTTGPAERDWPLAHVPVMIDRDEWAGIASALRQRADLLERVVADLYGPNRLVADGHLPASLVAQNAGWLRPLVGVTPPDGHFLHVIAFEIGRGPDGKWWVLGDRTEAPSGAGFALENRTATARIFPEFFGGPRIERLAGFFRAFQQALETAPDGHDTPGRIAILTPGPMNDGYFEHTFIARHLGLLLTEGEDLVVRGGRVLVRTVDGLQPVSVLWRRLDATSCDPIELDHRSQLGTPGLIDALRQGGVRMVNAPGTGILETRAFLSFLPRICRALTGGPLDMPNIATWWCGQKREREHVLAQRARMMIGPAFSTRLPFDAADGTALAGGTDREGLERRLAMQGRDLVGQEAVTLSTTPVWADGQLVARPLALRVFMARTPDGWQAMPGGYARIGSDADTAAIAMQQGGKVADVWIVGDSDRPSTPVAARPATRTHRQEPDALPSRSADNLFWLGRYVERAETAMRLFRAYHDRRGSGLPPDMPLMAELQRLLVPAPPGPAPVPDPARMARAFDMPLEAALTCAGRVRDRFSVDGMVALQDLVKAARKMREETIPMEDIPRKVSVLLRKITGFSGLVHENMYRSTGWRFLSLGLSLERAAQTAALLADLARDDAPDGALDLMLELGDSAMAHRTRYAGAATPVSVADLMALDGSNPRAILYHLDRAKVQIDHLPRATEQGRLGPVARLALQLHTRLRVETGETLTPAKLDGMRSGLWRLSDLMSDIYLR
ncbi:circularly permuted type 2 ATP-grasp protein [Meridianimarinicoccus sp. RP-17]|uniref:circularly permuted type 2 ATP-grasp protein n=1 Tax=Meridianimarinicoccus zhengii TaxID=2056810 RepID=UPI000DAE5159|nr:circularly permuted type 2 ATP-grasp protein [Phycocomes zhengii]